MAGPSGMKRSLPKELSTQLNKIQGKIAKTSGDLFELEDNKKRWLLVGVGLHTILSPALRKYVKPELDNLWQTLRASHNIDIQKYPNHLKKYKSPYPLNYEAINNNRLLRRYQQKSYNYSVKNSIDLSKLFLQTHMAHYSAFDEGCDASALLGIIINTGICPAGEKCAEQVRSKIRNRWAHCDHREWTDIKYNECLDLMKHLIQHLGFPDSEKKEILDQFNRWNRNGDKFIAGTTLELAGLTEIKDHVQDLVKCVKSLADTPEQIDKIQKALSNIDQVLKEHGELLSEHTERIGQLETAKQEQSEKLGQIEKETKDNTGSIAKLEKKIEEKEDSIPKHLKETHKIYVDGWEKDEEKFTVTRATKQVASLIKANNVVVVVGSSGSGKSSIIHHVALNLKTEHGYDIIPIVRGPWDIIHYRDENKNQLFVIDDLCGKNYINETDWQAWKTHLDKIETLFPVDPSSEQGKLKILVSCRLQISKNEQFKQLDLFSKKAVDLQSEKYCLLPEERSTMIAKYIKNNIPDYRWQEINKNLGDCYFFPLLCKLAKGKNIHQLHDLFSSPIHSIRKDIKDMILKNPIENCALVLCVLFPDGFHEDFIDPETRPQNVQQKVTEIIKNFKEVTLDNEREIEKFRKTFERLDGTYVKKLGPMYTISHDKICDMVAVEGSNYMTKLFLKYAPSTLISQLYRLKSIYKVDDNDILIYLNENYQNLYFDRIIQDLKQAKSYQPFFRNQQLKEEKYRIKVMEYIEQNKEFCNELFRRLDKEGMTEEHKCDRDDTHTYRTTPVIEAAKTGFYDLIQYFIQINCDCNEKDDFGYSPLYYSCYYGFVNVTDLLMRHGVEYRNELVRACHDGKIDVVRVIVNGGVDLYVYDSMSGQTPLTAACCGGWSEIVKLLLDKMALQCESSRLGQIPEPFQRDLTGRTALDWARSWEVRGDDTIINLLKSHMKQCHPSLCW